MFRSSAISCLRFSTAFRRASSSADTSLFWRPMRIHTGPELSVKPVAPPEIMASPKHVEYDWIDGVETLEEYVPGGYHPVLIGDILQDRYQVVDKLGYGGYSTIWLAYDRPHKRYVAVKIGMSDPSLPQSDLSILRKLSHESIPKILDNFTISGPNGTHPCYTMAPAQGNLNDALSSPMFPTAVGRALAAKLVLAVSYIHSRGYVHGDLHIRNMLVKTASNLDDLSIQQFRERFREPNRIPITRVDGQQLTPNVPKYAVVRVDLSKAARKYTVADARGLLLADFGEAFSPATEERLGRDSHTPLPGRAPETLFEPDTPLSFPSDIWTLGAAIWEILGMKFPFSQHVPTNELVAEHIDMLGYEDFPSDWRKTWERRAEDDEEDHMPRKPTRHPKDQWPTLERAWEDFNQKYRRKREATGIFSEEESSLILDLMRGMFRFRPEERLTAVEVLKSEWMVKWALPQIENNA